MDQSSTKNSIIIIFMLAQGPDPSRSSKAPIIHLVGAFSFFVSNPGTNPKIQGPMARATVAVGLEVALPRSQNANVGKAWSVRGGENRYPKVQG